MNEITRVGVDLAKSVIQINAVDTGGKLVTNARILWAIMTKGSRFDPRHERVKPTGPAIALG
jgi:hypothetical protein